MVEGTLKFHVRPGLGVPNRYKDIIERAIRETVGDTEVILRAARRACYQPPEHTAAYYAGKECFSVYSVCTRVCATRCIAY